MINEKLATRHNIRNVNILQVTLNGKKLNDKVAIYFEVYIVICQMVPSHQRLWQFEPSSLELPEPLAP